MDVKFNFGGQCPCCKNPLIQRIDDYPDSFEYDACLSCFYAYGHWTSMPSTPEKISNEIWDSIKKHHDCSSIDEVYKKYKQKIIEWNKYIDEYKRPMSNYGHPTINKIPINANDYRIKYAYNMNISKKCDCDSLHLIRKGHFKTCDYYRPLK